MRPLFLGIEIGASKQQIAMGGAEGDIMASTQGAVVLSSGAAGILDWMRENVPPLLSRAEEFGGDVLGIGVGFGGIIESATGVSLVSVQVQGWADFNLKAWFEETFALPTIVLNDTVAGCYGEFARGSGRGAEIFFYTNIGSGIGGALIIRGERYDGLGTGAAYLGHMYIPDWTSPRPGAGRKVEDICSGFAIERRLRSDGYVPADSALMTLCRGAKETVSCLMLGEAARAGDAFALAEVNRIAQSFATGLANVITLFSPDRVAIGGGVAKLGRLLLDPIRAHAGKLTFIPNQGRYTIVEGALGDAAVPVGAVLAAAREVAR